MSVRGRAESGHNDEDDEEEEEEECDPRTASPEAYGAFVRRLCARDRRRAGRAGVGVRHASVDELCAAVRTMAAHDRRQQLQGLCPPIPTPRASLSLSIDSQRRAVCCVLRVQ